MIPEQALFHLPEILVGLRYPHQKYEANILSALSLAVLQSLNGRNVPNPISCLHVERPYQNYGWKRGRNNIHLRSDLFLDLEQVGVSTDELRAFGWRRRVWIEAKLTKRTDVQHNRGELLADLLRLLALVSNLRKGKPGQRKINVARYLLHVYENIEPEVALGMNMDIAKKTEPKDAWITPLLTPGCNDCPNFELNVVGDGVLDHINPELKSLSIGFNATSWRISANKQWPSDANSRLYTCILTRIDTFTISRGEAKLKVSDNGSVNWHQRHKLFIKDVRDFVGSHLRYEQGEESTPEKKERDKIHPAERESDDQPRSISTRRRNAAKSKA